MDWFQSKNKITFFLRVFDIPPSKYFTYTLVILIGLVFLSTSEDVVRMSYVNSFFPCTARLWNFLPTECFPLTYDLNGFKSRVNRHLFYLGFLSSAFLYTFILFFILLSLSFPFILIFFSIPHNGFSALHGVKP